MQHQNPANDLDLPKFESNENDKLSQLFSKKDAGEKLETKLDSIQKKPKKKLFPLKKWQKIALAVSLIVLIISSMLGVVSFHTYTIALELKNKAYEGEFIARSAYDAFKAQNLPEAESQLLILQEKLDDIDHTYQKLSFYNSVPIIKNYYQDGNHGLKTAEHGLNAGLKAISTIAPYADVLGFEGEGTFTGGTAEDRIKLLIETLDAVVPAFDDIIMELELAESEFAKISPTRYPEEFRGLTIRSQLSQAQDLMRNSIDAFKEFRPVIEQLPDIAGGKDERRKYLVLFQNDNELRPTGGFLTAYAVIYMEDGKVTPEKSDDIYELDKKFTKRLPIPDALGRYLITERYWNLRDMNTSPDFKVSMDQFFENYQTVRGEPDNIDGIIAVDTHTLKGLLEVLGPVEIPGYGVFSAENDPRCDCPQVVYALSEIITKPTPYMREDRKGILGPMMQAILTKTYTANKQQWPALFDLAWKNIQQRHVQMYFLKQEFQVAAESINGAGVMRPPTDTKTDFLAIINANLGGAKSNLFTEYSVEQVVSAPENGKITKTVEITYKNNRKADNCNLEAGLLCLNSTLRDWTRLYLPQGSELIDSQGFTMEPQEYEENGFAVVDGFFTLEPLGVAKIRITYTVPYSDNDFYRAKLWKQGGIDPIPTLMDVTGGQEKIVVDKDMTYEVEF